MQVIRIYDRTTNELLFEDYYDKSQWCSAYNTACGGCTHCLERQAAYSGHRIEITDEETHQEPKETHIQ